MVNKGRVLVPEDDTHKQTITDVYKIYKTSYSKCYDSEEEIFYSDVVHHLEQHSASTRSETDSIYKYQIEDNSLKEALAAVPTWLTKLPQNYGVNVSVSLSCIDQKKEDSPLSYLEDMGIEVIEYVKLRIGYNYLKSHLSAKATVEDKSICPGLSGGFEDPIVLRMLHMQYINGEDYLKWVLRSKKKDDVKKKEFKSEERSSLRTSALKQTRSESIWKMGKETPISYSTYSKDEDLKNDYLFDASSDEKRKEEMPPLNANEMQHIIMLTQYEVIDQELPDDIDIFWPGKRDLENDFINFKTALSENILHQHFIQKFKSGKLERLDDDVRMEWKEYFMETRDCHTRKLQKSIQMKAENKQPGGGKKKCSWEKLKEQFKDYRISQEMTLSLFENVIKEKTRLEDLNLCCIISKLKEIHVENPDEVENEGDLIWKDMVIVRTKSKDSQSQITNEEVLKVINGEHTDDKFTQQNETDDEEDYDVVPEFTSMIYVTKVYPDPGIGYREDKCKQEFSSDVLVPEIGMKGGCTGYSMKDYKQPDVPQCSFKISPKITDENSLTNNSSAQNTGDANLSTPLRSSTSVQKNDYVTFHTDWSNYPYTEMLDIVFHRHHLGYVYITDVFEIKPDSLREINRIFHKTGKYSEEQSTKNSISSYVYQDSQRLPLCCQPLQNSDSNFENFPFALSPALTFLGEDKLKIKNQYKPSMVSPSSYLRSNTHQPNYGNISTSFSAVEDAEYIKIQNLQIEKDKDDHYQNESDSSTEDLDSESDTNYYMDRFKSSRVSSAGFDSHNEDVENKYPVCVDYNDVPSSTCNKFPDDDDYSDIVDFIKNFRFGEEKLKKPTNYQKPLEKTVTQEKGVFIDLLSSHSSQSSEEFIKLNKECDNLSVNSDNSLSLKDVKGFIGEKNHCSHEIRVNLSANDLVNPQPPRWNHDVSGEFYDAIIDKRRSVIQEFRTSFPLAYLYLTLKTNFSKINITGNLAKYKKWFQAIDQEYQTVLIRQNLNEPDQHNVKDQIPHHHILYEEIFGKYKTFNRETFSMAFCDPFIRHLIIREAFQDIGTNLSFFLLQFIENDRFNLLYQENKLEAINHEKIIGEVGKFLQTIRKSSRYKRFLQEIVVVHYFETKKYFSLEKLMQHDLNWEAIFKISRRIKIEDNTFVNVNYKDCVLQNCSEYSYLFFKLIKQINNEFIENNLFRQLLEPELHPKHINALTSTEMENLIAKYCSEFCESSLIAEVEMDILIIMRTIWKCEILGINYCRLHTSHIVNRFPNETANYFSYFFPNIFKVEVTVEDKKICRYNREFHYWHNNPRKNNELLTRNNLFYFEKLLTICLLQSVLTYYDYRIHG